MIFFFGTRLYGRVERCDGVFTATKFFHLFLLPLVPLQSIVVTAEAKPVTTTEGIPFLAMSSTTQAAISGVLRKSMSWKSVLLGYLRTWWTILDVFALFAIPIGLEEQKRGTNVGPLFAICLFIVLGHVVLVLAARGVPAEAAARRRVYAKFLGAAIDPVDAELGSLNGAVCALADFLRRRLRSTATSGDELVRAASDAAVRDPAILGAAMTLARIDGSPRMQLAHRALWQRLNAR